MNRNGWDNTGEDYFLYRDGYRHASWLSMFAQVLTPLRRLARDTAFLLVSINENELFNLAHLCGAELGPNAYTATFSVRVRHEDRILKGDKEIHEVLEYLLLYRLGGRAYAEGKQVKADGLDQYEWSVATNSPPTRVEELDGKRVEVYRSGSYAVQRVEAGRDGLKRINIRGTLRQGNSSGRFYVGNIEPMVERYQGSLLKVSDIGADGLGYRWFWIPPADHRRNNPDYFQGVPVDLQATRRVPYANFLDFETKFNRVADEGGVTFRDGKKPLAFLEHVLTIAGVAATQDGFIVDLFGGSGSTAECVMRLNSSDNGTRKFFLAEMGEYLPSITVPRLLNAARDAVATRRGRNDRPILQQVLELESYDDTLENVALKRDSALGALFRNNSALREDYTLRYLLDLESRGSLLNLDKFRKPWDYTIKVRKDGVVQDSPVDLVETFNYLLGLRVQRYDSFGQDGLLFVTGTNPDGQRVIVVWRDCDLWSNEDLEKKCKQAFEGFRPDEFDVVYVNGDHHLSIIRTGEERWKVNLTEEAFHDLMFDTSDVE